jgi:hypothetical protein
MYFPLLSNYIAEIISSSDTFSADYLSPNTYVNFQSNFGIESEAILNKKV